MTLIIKMYLDYLAEEDEHILEYEMKSDEFNYEELKQSDLFAVK